MIGRLLLDSIKILFIILNFERPAPCYQWNSQSESFRAEQVSVVKTKSDRSI
jgi:hypothetical protein